MKAKDINIARGIEQADLVIKNVNLVNVLSEEIYETDIAISGDTICGLGHGYVGKTEIDAKGYYACPAFIDGHVHLESSMVMPAEFAKAVLPTGTTTVFTDPHEIANVMGLDGIKFMHNNSKHIGLDVKFMLPSCVPATPFENSGYTLTADDLKILINKNWIYGLAEMMNFVGVINLDEDVHKKIDMVKAHHKQIDGHAPMLSGKDLCAYAAAGIKSDHECTIPDEALEKLRLGFYVMVREGSAAKDLNALLPFLKNNNTRKCIFVTDDRHPTDLDEHINGMVRRAVEYGIPPIKAIQCTGLNTAEYFGIKNLGAIAPEYKADILILNNLSDFKPRIVIKNGKIVAKHGKLIAQKRHNNKHVCTNSVNVAPLKLQDFAIHTASLAVKAIEIVPNQLVTKSVVSKIKKINNNAVSNLENDTLKICVIERHHATGNIGKGFIRGIGLKSGAIASTVAHDSHNMIIIGTNDEDMLFAAQELIKSQGGKIVVQNGKVLAKAELPIAGLISDKSIDEVKAECHNLAKAVKTIGSTLDDAFMTMGFLSLPVIPELKITDKGLFNTNTFSFVSIDA